MAPLAALATKAAMAVMAVVLSSMGIRHYRKQITNRKHTFGTSMESSSAEVLDEFGSTPLEEFGSTLGTLGCV